MSQRCQRDKIREEDSYPHGCLFGPWEPRRWRPRPGNLADPQSRKLAELVRGELIERLDSLLLQAVPVWQADWGLSRSQCLSLIQTVQLGLFPDEFSGDDATDAEIARLVGDRKALVPLDAPIERVGKEALAAYADYLGVQYDAADEPDPEPDVIGGVRFPAGVRARLEGRSR